MASTSPATRGGRMRVGVGRRHRSEGLAGLSTEEPTGGRDASTGSGPIT